MKYSIALLVLSFFPILSSAQSFETIFISAEKLHEDLGDPDLVILQTDNPEHYEKGHIPGAVLFQSSQYAVTRDDLYYELPDAGFFKEQLLKSGIDQESRIVICSGWETFAHAYRLYVTLSYYGLERQTRILDGGIRTWSALDLPLSKDSVIVNPVDNSSLELQKNPSFLVDMNLVSEHISNPDFLIIDGRKDDYYSGKEKGRYSRPGHIQSAKNITWTTLVDDNFKLLDTERLNEKYKDAGASKDHTIIAYCHVGLRASVIYTVGKALGYTMRLYDGSYNEWDGLDPQKYPSSTE